MSLYNYPSNIKNVTLHYTFFFTIHFYLWSQNFTLSLILLRLRRFRIAIRLHRKDMWRLERSLTILFPIHQRESVCVFNIRACITVYFAKNWNGVYCSSKKEARMLVFSGSKDHFLLYDLECPLFSFLMEMKSLKQVFSKSDFTRRAVNWRLRSGSRIFCHLLQIQFCVSRINNCLTDEGLWNLWRALKEWLFHYSLNIGGKTV